MRTRYALYAVLIIAAVLLVARFGWLAKDPPMFHVGHGQAELTDPYHLTYAARSEVLFDTWNLFDIHRWDVFRNSLVSGAAYVLFALFGVSRVTANLAALLLQIGGFLFFVWGLYRSREDLWPAALTALLLLVNSSLFFYGRLPFLENGLIFLSGLLFFVFVRYHERYWGLALVGVLAALAGLAGKLFGLLLLGPVVLTLIYRYRAKAAIPIGVTLGSAVVGGGLYLLLLYGGDLTNMMAYYSEQSVGMYGSPPGFSSVGGFFTMLVTYGGESGLWEYLPFFLILTAVSLIVVTLKTPLGGEPDQGHLRVVFCAAWLLCGVLALSPFYYRPLRYGLFLLLPAAALGGFALRYAFERYVKIDLPMKWVSVPLVFFSFWYAATQVQILFSPVGKKFASGANAMFMTGFVALILTGLVVVLFYRGRRIPARKIMAPVLTLLLAATVIWQGVLVARGLSRPGEYLHRYNEEVAAMVGPQAVLTGPYAATLAIDNELRSIIYMFGLANRQEDLFTGYPVTHIATDQTNWQAALKDFPFLASSEKIVEMVVRDQIIDLYRVPGALSPLTDFERGALAFGRRQPDSGLVYFGRFSQAHPDHILGRTHYITALHLVGRSDEARGLMERLLAQHPDNYLVHGFAKVFYRMLFSATGNPTYRRLADEHDRRSLELNPAMNRGG